MPSSRLRETLVQAQSKGLEKEALEEQLKKQVRVITAQAKEKLCHTWKLAMN